MIAIFGLSRTSQQ